jgi:hypothetical protein
MSLTQLGATLVGTTSGILLGGYIVDKAFPYKSLSSMGNGGATYAPIDLVMSPIVSMGNYFVGSTIGGISGTVIGYLASDDHNNIVNQNLGTAMTLLAGVAIGAYVFGHAE